MYKVSLVKLSPLGGGFMLLASIFLGCATGDIPAPRASTPPLAPAVTPRQGDLDLGLPSVSSIMLYSDYQADAVEANKRYRGQELLITGVIAKIRTDSFFDIYLVLPGISLAV